MISRRTHLMIRRPRPGHRAKAGSPQRKYVLCTHEKGCAMKHAIRSIVLVLLCLAAAAQSVADPYRIDAAHSSVSFSIRHIFSKVSGRFTKFKGMIQFDPNAPEKTVVDITLETASISTDNERRDGDLRSANFFLADSFPTITFKSTKTYRNEKGLFVEGNLTIRGTTRSVVAPFEVLGVGGEPGKMVAGFASAFKINRKDYGITWNKAADVGGMLLGDDVEINIGIEARYLLE
jgi:polyisoprenoid-binding protein YceI